MKKTHHCHILLFLEGSVSEDVHDIEGMDSDEQPNFQQDRYFTILSKSTIYPVIHLTVVRELRIGNVALDMTPVVST